MLILIEKSKSKDGNTFIYGGVLPYKRRKAIQAKIPTGRKVHPSLWDSRKQQPIMINKDIDLTNKQLQEQAALTAYIAQARILVYSEKKS